MSRQGKSHDNIRKRFYDKRDRTTTRKRRQKNHPEKDINVYFITQPGVFYIMGNVI